MISSAEGSLMNDRIEPIINALKEIAAQDGKPDNATSYAFVKKASLQALQKYTDDRFKDSVRLLRQLKGEDTEALFDCSGDVLSRRKRALLTLAPDVSRRFKGKYPDISAEEAFILLNAPTSAMTFDALGQSIYIETAAAIWLLDYLLENDRMDEALAFLPAKRDELDSIELPNISDSIHNDDMLRGMLYVIRNRNRGTDGFSADRAFMDGADARRAPEPAEATADRRNFDGIMSLIDTITAENIREMFTASFWRVTDGLLGICADIEREIHLLDAEKRQTASAFVGRLESGNIAGEALASETLAVKSKTDALDEKLSTLQYQKEAFFLNVPSLPVKKDDSDLGALSGKLPHIETANPYAYCFGFLNLLDADSDFAWVYNISCYVLASACSALPWAGAHDADDDEDMPEINPALLNAARSSGDRYAVSPEENILNRRIAEPLFADEAGEKITFSRLVYLISGMVPPRSRTGMSYMKSLFEDSGLSDSEIHILYEYLILAYSVSQRDSNYVFIDEDDTDASPSQTDVADTASDADAQLKALKQENKMLKGLINRLEHKIKGGAEELRKAESELSKSRAELAELRSMIRRADAAEEELTATVSFPYTSKKRAVVFGGHESWSKAIRPLLKNVRFVEASALPNAALIMNAESVWIQTNAISHSSFYKIIDIVRKHHIDLHYFKYSGAEKCAEQFALEDEAADGLPAKAP